MFQACLLENFYPVNTSVHVNLYLLCFRHVYWRTSILTKPVLLLTYVCYVLGMYLENFYPFYTSVNVDLYLLCFRHVFGEFQSC